MVLLKFNSDSSSNAFQLLARNLTPWVWEEYLQKLELLRKKMKKKKKRLGIKATWCDTHMMQNRNWYHGRFYSWMHRRICSKYRCWFICAHLKNGAVCAKEFINVAWPAFAEYAISTVYWVKSRRNGKSINDTLSMDYQASDAVRSHNVAVIAPQFMYCASMRRNTGSLRQLRG